jgi:flagellar basal body-associated protein FliL
MSVKASNNRMLHLYVAGVMIFVILGAYGEYYEADRSGLIEHAAPRSHSILTEMAYLDLPRVTVDVGSGVDKTHVRIDISLEVAKADIPVFEGYQPRITDRINYFFMHVRPDQVLALGTQPFLREELIRQINKAGAPVPVHAIVLRQMVIM